MAVDAGSLLGAWRLVSWSLIHPDGRREHPLGSDAVGLIMYTPDGHVSATLMRRARPAGQPSTADDRAQAYTESFCYAGRFQVRDGAVHHAIEIAANPALIGLTTTRRIALDGDRLVLAGPDFAAGSERLQEIVWRRA